MPGGKAKPIAFHVVYYLLVVGLVYFGWSYTSAVPNIIEDRVDTLLKVQEKELETFLQMNGLLITLATAVLGGTGAVLFNRFKSGELGWAALARIGLSSILSGLSLLFGYLSYSRVVWMLHSHFFNLSNAELLFPQRAQFWLFVIALLFFADFSLDGLLNPQP